MKTFRILGAAVACMALLPVFISCDGDGDGDDDDDGGGGGNDVPVSAPLVTSAGYYDFTYDNKGRVTGAFDGDWACLIDYSKGTIRTIEDDFEETYDAKFNSNGTIKEIAYAYTYLEEDEKGKGTATFSYNKQGYLTSINVNSTETVSYETYTSKSNWTFTWDEDNLTQVKYTEDYNNNGEKEWQNGECLISYSSTENSFKQFPILFVEDMIGLPFSWFSVTGLFGPGPANFPSKYHWIYSDNYGSEIEDGTFRYILNNQDAIRREYHDDDQYADYSYDSSRSEKTITTHKPGKHRRLFRFGRHE